MPIPLDEFEQGEEPTGERRSSVTPSVIEFMKTNAETAYTTKEVATAVDANGATVNHVLRRLTEKGSVERKVVNGLIYCRWLGGEEEEA